MHIAKVESGLECAVRTALLRSPIPESDRASTTQLLDVVQSRSEKVG